MELAALGSMQPQVRIQEDLIALYLRLKDGRDADPAPRTFIYAGKAAPGYRMAKLIIKLINAVSSMINRDPATRDRLRVVFVPNFSVRTGQRIYPCADLSEQVSTAGKEASGTGNMKFTLNGALTIARSTAPTSKSARKSAR